MSRRKKERTVVYREQILELYARAARVEDQQTMMACRRIAAMDPELAKMFSHMDLFTNNLVIAIHNFLNKDFSESEILETLDKVVSNLGDEPENDC